MRINLVAGNRGRARSVGVVACVVACATLATGALAATSSWRVVGKGSASGDFAVAAANGTAKRPTAMAVRVLVTKRQTVNVFAVSACAKGFGVGSKSAQFKLRAPAMRVLKMPMAKADSCDVTASASITGGGRVTVQVLAR